MVKVVGKPGAKGGTKANGGDGGAAVASDPETGAASKIVGSATAEGGAGGYAGNGFIPGKGGLADATASAANTLTAGASASYADAIAGAGGEGYTNNKISSPGAPGGAAEATSTALAPGAATAKATAIGGAGGERVTRGSGADGGAATATASATGQTANAVATALGGGAGGGGENGGDGNSGPATASATAAGITWASATADITGGIDGSSPAVVNLTNAVSGSTQGGTLSLNQTATGSYAGNWINWGGSAHSYLTFDDTKSVTQSAKVKAVVAAVDGKGEHAGSADAYLNLTGAALTASTVATADAVNDPLNHIYDSGGSGASAQTIANATGSVFATSSAAAIESAGAYADTTATGTSGALQASASTKGHAQYGNQSGDATLSAATSGKVAGGSEDQAEALFGAGDGFDNALQGGLSLPPALRATLPLPRRRITRRSERPLARRLTFLPWVRWADIILQPRPRPRP